jgi:antibiotic biosynthesis monooxygenase (ABM) superfamily enzyme
MPKKKRFRIFIDFDSEEDMKAWAQGTEKRPYEIKRADALDAMYSGNYRISKFVITKFLDENAPLETDLHPIAQGIRFSRLG